MKKFYLLTISASIAISAFAGEPGIYGETLLKEKSQKTHVSNADNMNIVAQPARKNMKVMSARKVDGTASIEGTWTFLMGDYYFESSIDGTIFIDYEATLSGTELKFTDPTNAKPPFYAQYNSEAGILTFNPKDLGERGKYYTYQKPFVYSYETNSMVYQSIKCTFLSTGGGELVFEPENGIEWPAYSGPNETDKVGYFAIYDLEGAIKSDYDDSGDDENWTTIGNARLIDPWILPGFDYNQWDERYQWEVPLQKNNYNSGIYRLVNPYSKGPVAGANTSKVKGYITFDVSDPNHVIFITGVSGFAYSKSDILQFFCTNTLSYYMDKYGYSAEEIIDIVGNSIPYTTFKNGIVSLGSINTEEGIVYDANFGTQDSPDGGFTWGDINMTGQIVFPENMDSSIDAIGLEQGKVRYFNLQGVEVRNPKAGSVVIRTDGSKAIKVIM